jgi:hypothetical protein
VFLQQLIQLCVVGHVSARQHCGGVETPAQCFKYGGGCCDGLFKAVMVEQGGSILANMSQRAQNKMLDVLNSVGMSHPAAIRIIS